MWRNRPWRASGTGFVFEPAEHVQPAAQAAAQLLGTELVLRAERETLAFVERERSFDPSGAASHIANKTLRLTADEAASSSDAGGARRALPPEHVGRRPADARAARMLIRLFPRDLPAA